MSILTAEQLKALNKQKSNIEFYTLINASLAAFWAASAEFNSAIHGLETQNLGDVTGAIGGEDNAKELEELLQGLDALSSVGGDFISSIIPAFVLAAGFGIRHYTKVNDTDIAMAIAERALITGLGNGIAYAGSKEIMSQIAIHTITAANPLLHIPASIGFAIFYAIFATLFQLYAEYRSLKDLCIKQAMLDDKPHLTSFTAFIQHKIKDNENFSFRKEFFCNFMVGLGLYVSTLIPGLNTAGSIATTVAITTATSAGTRAAWTIAAAPRPRIDTIPIDSSHASINRSSHATNDSSRASTNDSSHASINMGGDASSKESSGGVRYLSIQQK
ncbi:MAG: hypothetical protein ABSF18_05115 [Gammaproteobacteria bacterium]|jgi:hypothetical protein